jgi:hypothetical protein
MDGLTAKCLVPGGVCIDRNIFQRLSVEQPRERIAAALETCRQDATPSSGRKPRCISTAPEAGGSAADDDRVN